MPINNETIETTAKNAQATNVQSETDVPQSTATTPQINEKQKKKNKFPRKLKTFLIWTLILILAIWLILFLSAQIAEFDSISDMLRFIQAEIQKGSLKT